MKRLLIIAVAILFFSPAESQQTLEYRLPPDEILELADYQRAPLILVNDHYDRMVYAYRETYPTLKELAEGEVKLASLRANPRTRLPSGTTEYFDLQTKNLTDKEPARFSGLPENGRFSHFVWSPDQTKMAFVHNTGDKIELWMADIDERKVWKLSDRAVNPVFERPFVWGRDGSSLLVRVVPAIYRDYYGPTEDPIPVGPRIAESIPGEKIRNRTHQDLLKNPSDEEQFKILTTSEILRIDLEGNIESWAGPGIYSRFSFSPNGEYVLVDEYLTPFSYRVPYSRFARRTMVLDKDGGRIGILSERKAVETYAAGRMSTVPGRRNIGWRSDCPATLYWVEALDGGAADVETEYRDELFELPAPFDGTPRSVVKTRDRYEKIEWGTAHTAIVYDYWWNTRNSRAYVFDPSDASKPPVVLFDRNYQDAYADPGEFLKVRNAFGTRVLRIDNGSVFLMGEGFTTEGQFPFIDRMELATGKKERLWTFPYSDKFGEIVSTSRLEMNEILVRMQSPTECANLYRVPLRKKSDPIQVTFNKNPSDKLANVYKEVVKYNRSDGLELSGTLYLPEGYDREGGERLPLLMWAYPTEYKDRETATQVTVNPNRFTYPTYGSPIWWVVRGYAVLDKASFPIVGEGDREPNDTYMEQLVDNARSAIDYLDSLGYIDRNRVAVGGHSYGGFMTANLLTHTDLFAAGIARSGAYNRTLTPFGFQSEDRNFWEATDVYLKMAPFIHADKMKTPLLLIHGENDGNSGTHTMQSERYFEALNGLGAPARLVILPLENHGYRARESILHLLWEQDRWLEEHVKNRK